jgi:hypothetical protein
MVGLLVCSIGSGQLIARTGRYKVFPVIGTVVMASGLFLLSRLDVGTSALQSSLYLLVLGAGLGMTMQVLVLAVQNSVDFEVLGSATSGVTLMRGIGGSLGAAIFGTIFSSRLASELAGSAASSSSAASGARLTGNQVAALPVTARTAYESAYVHALTPVFVMAGTVALVAFLISLRLRERPLRETAATSRGLEDGLAAPRGDSALDEVRRALSLATTVEERRRFRTGIAERAGLDLSPGAIWALLRIDELGVEPARRRALERVGASSERVEEVMGELSRSGYLERDGEERLTLSGREAAVRAVAAREEQLHGVLHDSEAERDPEVTELLHRLARELAGEPA